ncbi:hypothetical protein BHE74_00035076 [Ensete ventricosum]|nr:hypothetical protein BHE74_00035076 [Ensete ventricosum]
MQAMVSSTHDDETLLVEEERGCGEGLATVGWEAVAAHCCARLIFFTCGVAEQFAEATVMRGRSSSRSAGRQKVRLEAKEEAGNGVGSWLRRDRYVVNRDEGLTVVDFSDHVSLAKKEGAGMVGRGDPAWGMHTWVATVIEATIRWVQPETAMKRLKVVVVGGWEQKATVDNQGYAPVGSGRESRRCSSSGRGWRRGYRVAAKEEGGGM